MRAPPMFRKLATAKIRRRQVICLIYTRQEQTLGNVLLNWMKKYPFIVTKNIWLRPVEKAGAMKKVSDSP